MIIKELYELYERLAKYSEQIPRFGWSVQGVGFRLVLDRDGTLVAIEDVRHTTSGQKKAVMSDAIVPGNSKPPGSGINPCFLWDNMAYLLGNTQEKPRALDYFEGFKERHLALEERIHSEAFSAVCRFLERWEPSRCAAVFREHKKNISDFTKCNGVFRLHGHEVDVHEEREIRAWWDTQGTADRKRSAEWGVCLVSGQLAPIAILHEPAIRGVTNAQSSGAKIVSYNCKSFESYGKEQGENAPVSEIVAHEYACALNYLLRQGDGIKQRAHVGDATVVFWTDAPRERAEIFKLFAASVFNSSVVEKAQDPQLVQIVRSWLSRIAQGKIPGTQKDWKEWKATRFFVLGLSPNASRLSIRFFYQSTLAEWTEHLTAHYAAMQLQKRSPKFKDPEFITPKRILDETERNAEDISPLAAGALMRSILSGRPYPNSVAMSILRRFRADGHINYVRCAFLKAWLIRNYNFHNLQTMLDTNNTQPGYVLGRFFAVLAKVQKDVLPNINRTIQDAYYGSASASPAAVFPRILRLHRHHLAASSMRISYEILEQEICDKLDHFPAHLNLVQQGLFALGFYHQTQSLFTKKNNTTDKENEQN